MDQDAQDVGDGADTTLTGSDALRFLCSNLGEDSKQACVLGKSNTFSRLFTATVQGRKTTMTSSPASSAPSTSMLCSPRKQRKSCKPSRVPALKEESVLPLPKSPLTDSPLTFTTMSNHPTAHEEEDSSLVKAMAAISGKSWVAHEEDSSLVKAMAAISGKRTTAAMNDRHGKTLWRTEMRNGKCGKKKINQRGGGTVVCKNLACKAILCSGAPFCKRCSCCICKEFDDNKDPSLWITCDAEEQDGCGLSCHMECALKDKVVGVTDQTGGPVLLDGGFFCRSCGKISSIIGLWKKQLLIAKNARRVDVFCHRLFLSHRLLKGTLKHKDIHTLIDDAKKKLEVEVCLMTKCFAKFERCIVNRLSCNQEVQALIDAALERADIVYNGKAEKYAETCKKALCTVRFEDARASSVVVVALDDHPCDGGLVYNLWHRKATDPFYPVAPMYTIQGPSKKVLVSDLQPDTLYSFKMAPLGDGEACEAECRTRSTDPMGVENHVDDGTSDDFVCYLDKGETKDVPNHSFNIRKCIEKGSREGPPAMEDSNPVKTPSMSEAYEGKVNNSVEEMGDAGTEIIDLATDARESTDQDVCETAKLVRVSGVDPDEDPSGRKEVALDYSPTSTVVMAANAEISINGTISASQSLAMKSLCHGAQGSEIEVAHAGLMGAFVAPNEYTGADTHSLEFSIRVVRWLEREGHLDREFRVKFLTWYSLRATDHEKRVVRVFIDTLQDSATSLAAQLVDAFEDVIDDAKRQRMTNIGYYRRRHK